MTQNTVNPQLDFTTLDVIQLEEKIYADFQRLQKPYREVNYKFSASSVAPETPRNAYYDGDWDARLAIEPTCENWLNKSYRQGYLDGIANKYDEKFGVLI